MCEIRRKNLHGLWIGVVSDHRPSLATLRYDMERAIPKAPPLRQYHVSLTKLDNRTD